VYPPENLPVKEDMPLKEVSQIFCCQLPQAKASGELFLPRQYYYGHTPPQARG
jgi:hypothetical protein